MTFERLVIWNFKTAGGPGAVVTSLAATEEEVRIYIDRTLSNQVGWDPKSLTRREKRVKVQSLKLDIEVQNKGVDDE